MSDNNLTTQGAKQIECKSTTILNNKPPTPQSIYDSFNSLIFSDDTRVFNKMTKRIELYLSIRDLQGDIVEFGVFKGSGIALFLKLKELYEPHSLTKVIGFDYFNPTLLLESLTNDEDSKNFMNTVVNRCDHNELSVSSVNSRLSIFKSYNYNLIEGESVQQCKLYYKKNIGARIKLLYMDLDLGEPTYHILKEIWSRVVVNGIIVLDEYGFDKCDESNGVDRFLKEIKGEYAVFNTFVTNPTLYIKKL